MGMLQTSYLLQPTTIHNITSTVLTVMTPLLILTDSSYTCSTAEAGVSKMSKLFWQTAMELIQCVKYVDSSRRLTCYLFTAVGIRKKQVSRRKCCQKGSSFLSFKHFTFPTKDSNAFGDWDQVLLCSAHYHTHTESRIQIKTGAIWENDSLLWISPSWNTRPILTGLSLLHHQGPRRL